MFICACCGKEVDTVYFHGKEEVCEKCLKIIKENEEAGEEITGNNLRIRKLTG